MDYEGDTFISSLLSGHQILQVVQIVVVVEVEPSLHQQQ